MMRSMPRRRPLWLVLLVLGTLPVVTGACSDAPIATGTPPVEPPVHRGGRVLGLVEVTLTGVGTPDVRASAVPVRPGILPDSDRGGAPSTTAAGVHLEMRPVSSGDGTIQLEPISAGSFTDGVRGSGGQRYLYATFKVRNATEAGAPYMDARTNLTFLAASTAETLNGTPISQLGRFDSSTADPAIASEILPTGALTRNTMSGQPAAETPDVLQVLTEGELTSIVPPAGVTSVFPYGFVVRNASDPTSRTLSANPATDEFDGVVTFAFRLPLQTTAAADPFTVSVMFLAVDDDETRLTQSLEEHGRAATEAVEARARALGATTLTLLPGNGAFVNGIDKRVVCEVRTAGLAGAPTHSLTAPSGTGVWLVPSPMGAGFHPLSPGEAMAAAGCPSIAAADASRFVVHGLQSGSLSGTYTGLGTPVVDFQLPSGADFFPGEEVEVTLTSALAGTAPVVGRYRVAVTKGSGSFNESSNSVDLTGQFPHATIVADLDGDGDLDLASTDDISDTVRVLTNDGAGNFKVVDTLQAGDAPWSVAAADLDADGDLDLATVNISSNNVSIFMNDATGHFTSTATVSVGSSPASIIAADLDGDGHVDLATADQGSNSVTILGNDGHGSFTKTTTVPVGAGTGPLSLAAADLDGDGDLDLAVTNNFVNTLSILENDGTGAFTVASTPLAGSRPSSITAADLDGDGDLDLAVTNQDANTVTILIHNDTGAFTIAGTVGVGQLPVGIVAADVDGDGDLDLATVNEVSDNATILMNNGRGGFRSAATVVVHSTPLSIVAGDVDGDGDLDLVLALRSSPARIGILSNQ